MAEPIPGPPGLPLLGNLNDIDPGDSMSSLSRLADTYGIYFPSIGRRSIALTF
jgi:cytochrome P450 / NADPH-cytochrome P450 reductase